MFSLSFSLAVNVLVLLPVLSGLMRDRSWARQAYGPRTPARDILTSIYITILIASAFILITGTETHAVPAVSLLAIQVVYKLLTPFLVGDLRNPVVLSNIAIALLHSLTLINHYLTVQKRAG